MTDSADATRVRDAVAKRFAPPRLRQWAGWLVFLLLLTGAIASALQIAHAGSSRAVTYIVVPHPDDEFQTWSLVENTPNQYKVFVVLTEGEQTQYCEPEPYEAAYQVGLERPAEPTPLGRWSKECAQARADSLIGYLTDMSASDATIPGDFGDAVTSGPFPVTSGTVCRADEGDQCTVEDHSARVWADQRGRGAVVLLNLGDGDLTAGEVRWGVETVLANRAALGIDSELPNAGIIGSFANSHYSCFTYQHSDHRAVHDALWNTDFGTGFQAAATCKNDPDRAISNTVSDTSTDAAFLVGEGPDDFERRLGAHTNNYGWLWPDYYHVDRDDQQLLFTQHQYFWTRFVD